ncbi:hypothetical protein B0H14DRAFT_2674574, partial [Mycena olivaceomarginata]
LSFLDDATRKFHKEIGDAHSIIREYTSSTEGVLYFVAAGRNRVGHVVLPNRLSSFQELAVEFFAQIRDPSLAQLVWGHGRVIRKPGTPLESSFVATKERGILEGGGEVAYYWVQPGRGQQLPYHHQLQLTRDYNFLHLPADDFKNLITFMRPYMMWARQNMTLEYVYAVLAVLHRLPKKSQRLVYLEHQAAYLNGEARVEWSALSEVKIDTCLESAIPLVEVLQQAQKRIRKLMKLLSASAMLDVVNLRPTLEQQEAARDIGFSFELWSVNTSTAFALHGRQQVNMTYIEQINPLRAALRAAAYPPLIHSDMESEYVDYAKRALLAVKNGEDLPVLPSTPIRIGLETLYA